MSVLNRALVCVVVFIASLGSASAIPTDLRVLFDSDNNVATGCAAYGFPGIEQVLTTTLETSGTPHVVSVARQSCAGGVLGSPVVIDSTGWPATYNAASGTFTAETRLARSVFGASAPMGMRLRFLASSGTAAATLLADANGNPILFPIDRNRRRTAPGTTPVRVITLDGQTGDWNGISPLATGGANDGTRILRLINVYGFFNDENFYFRFDGQANANAPTAEDDSYAVDPGATLNISAPGVLANDTDPRSLPLTAAIVGSTSHGAVVLNSDGSFSYANDGTGERDVFTYQASNGEQTSNVARAEIRIGDRANQRPVGTDDSYSVLQGGVLEVPPPGVLANDTDADGDSLTATLATPPSFGSVVLSPDGSFTYNSSGTVGEDSFTYVANDGRANSLPVTVRITVNPDLPPIAVNDGYTVAEGGTLSIGAPGVLSNDSDPDSPPSALVATLVTSTTRGSLFLSASGAFTYVHNGSETTSDSFTYLVSDGRSNSNIATVLITVTPVNDVPVAAPNAYTTAEDTPLTVLGPGVLGNDSDGEGTGLTAVLVTTTPNGALTLNPDGSFFYSPNANFNGIDTFTYSANDGVASSAPATVTITVTAVNDPPSFTAGGNVVVVEGSGPFSAPWATAISPGAPNESAQTLTFLVSNDNNGLFTVQPAISPAGVLTLTPGTGVTGVATVTVTLQDNGGGSNSSGTVTFTITVARVPAFTSPNSTTFNATIPGTFTVTTTGFPTPALSQTGTLPTGITFVDNGNGTATIGGTAPQGAGGLYPITINASNVGGTTPQSFTITVCNQIAVSNPTTTVGTAGAAFSQTFTQTGAVGTATFTLASGTLPAGLVLASNGTLAGTPTQTGSFPITVTVTDANGCSATGATYTLVIGCQVIPVSNPANSNGTVNAAFSEAFTQSGAIGTATFTTASTLPAGLTLSAAGVLSGTPTQNGSFPIVVTVTDANGCTGTSATYTLVIGCQTITVTSPANTNGTVSSAFSETFTQSGAFGTATFSTASTLPAGVTLSAAGVLSGIPTQDGFFPIVVTVTDSNGCTGTSATYNLVIGCQLITVSSPANATGAAGSPFSETFTQAGGFGAVTFTTASTLPTGLTLAANGVLSGTPGQGGTFPITVTATDSNGCTGVSGTYNLTITCPTITVSNPANGNGTANAAFSETFLQSGGIGTATFTLASGTLPAGLTLAANGVLSGTPTQTGSFPITVTATDSNGCTGTGSTYTIVIGCQTITVNNPANANGTANSAFSETFTQTGAIGSATFTLASGTLPAGLTLAANGTLSGTPTQTGSFPITVTVTDANGCTGTSATYTIVIGCQVITVNNPANANGTVNAAFSESFTQSNAIGSVTFATASTLPAGLTFAANGVLSGTPTQPGSFPIVVTVTDANGCTGTGATYTLVIGCQTITVTNPANTNGTVNASFSETFTHSGSVGTATFTTASTLPAGLTLSTAGVLSGTPTEAGSFPIVITVTDSNGCTGTSGTYNLVVGCQLITVNNPANATGPAGTPFSEPFTQTGAIGTATFTLASGTLPTGLTLAANGTLSGTPTQGGSFPITVTVTDSNGCTGTSATYTLVITCPVITVSNPVNANGTAGSAFGETFTQTGGQGTATFTLASGTLPAGLTLAANGLLSGTPTQTGSFPITVTATDSNGCTGTGTTYTIVIACQTITVNNPANGNGIAGAAFSETFTQTGGIGSATFTLASGTLPAGLTLATNGTLSGNPTQTGSFPITVTVTDSNSCTGTSGTYTIVIGCQTITVNNPANANGQVNVAFSETFTQSGAIGAGTFTTSSTLPAGITLSTAGVLSGTTTQAGTFPIVVTVTDANGCTGTSATYNLVIACQTITVGNPANTTGTVGTPFTETFTQAGVLGTASFTTSSTLPAGLTLSSAGVLSGTPTQSGAFPITVVVTDSLNSCTGTSTTYNLVIACQTITVTNPTTTTGTVDASFSETFTQSGAIGTATFTTSSTLPAGITLSTAGVLSGTPLQPGTFPIVVTVTDSNGCTGTSSTYTLVIACQTITVTNPATTTGTVDAPFSQTFTQTGVGVHTPATFTTSSTLPSGLTLSSAGVLSGTPGQPGTFPITVTVTDVNGCTGTSATYNLVIACQVITVTNPGVTSAVFNSPFSQTFTQSGVGTHGPAVFTTSSTLPTGLTLSTAGVLSGTPTQTGTFPITVTVTDANGCTGTGGTYTLSVAPVAVGDSFNNGVNNTQYVLTGGTTATPSTPAVALSGSIATNDLPNGGVTVVAGTFATTNSGSVTIAADGTFLYTPPAQPGSPALAADTFTYTVTSNTGGTGPVTSAAATVTINLANRVWYVKNNSSAGGDGRSQAPFDTLAEAQTASTANDYIYVYFGDGTNSGQNAGITLKNGQKLYGQGIALVVNAQNLVAAGSQALIGNSGGVGVTVTNLTGIEIKGLSISASTDAILAVTTAANSGGIEIAQNTITGAGNEGIDLDGSGSGTFTASIHDNTVTATGNGIEVIRLAGTLFLTAFDDNTISGNTAGSGIVVTSATFDAAPGGAFDFVSGGNTQIGASGNSVGASGMLLTTIGGDLQFTDLDIFAGSGSGLTLTGNGALNSAGASGTGLLIATNAGTISAAGGPAVSVNNATIDAQLQSLTSASTATTGVSLTNVSDSVSYSARFSAPSGSSITSTGAATGPLFNVSGGNVGISYGGTISNNGTGRAVFVDSLAMDDATDNLSFSGAISENGAGILLNNNSGATRTITFSGNLTISTTSGEGFAATSNSNSGGLNITGTNTISSVSATALRITNTAIGSSNVTFRSISSGNNNASADPSSGIILTTTGNLGGLIVTGTGSAGTGGTIQRTTGSGIALTSTTGVNLSFMNVQNSGDDGINGSSVTGFNLTSMSITSNGNAVGDRGIEMTQLGGSCSIANSTISGSAEHNVVVTNDTVNLTSFNVTGSSFLTTNFTTGDDGLQILNTGNAAMTVSVTGSTFTDNKGDHFQAATDADATGSINVTFNNNTLSTTAANDPLVIGGGITINSSGTADINFLISGNNIQQAFDDAININLDPGSLVGANMIGTISSNIIGTSGTAASGCESSNTVTIASKGAGFTDIDVLNNQIFEWGNQYGIFLGISEGSSSMVAKVTGNTLHTTFPNALLINGIRVDAGATATDNGTLEVLLTGNDVAGEGNAANGDADIRLRQRFLTRIKLPGYGGANTDTAAVNSFVAGNNSPAPTVSSAQNVAGGGGGFVGGPVTP